MASLLIRHTEKLEGEVPVSSAVGYTLKKKSIQYMLNQWHHLLPKCQPPKRTFGSSTAWGWIGCDKWPWTLSTLLIMSGGQEWNHHHTNWIAHLNSPALVDGHLCVNVCIFTFWKSYLSFMNQTLSLVYYKPSNHSLSNRKCGIISYSSEI